MDITEEDFLKTWKAVCKENEQLLVNNWNKDYTNVILGKNNQDSIVVKIKDRLKSKFESIDIHQEYYSCDVVFYEEQDMVKREDLKISNAPLNLKGVYLKSLPIHFEHENLISDSWKEIVQFQNIPGKLNVLVTYPKNRDGEYQEEINKIIDRYKNVLADDLKSKQDASDKEKIRILVIFGVLKESSINWYGYKLENGKFNPISNNGNQSLSEEILDKNSKSNR